MNFRQQKIPHEKQKPGDAGLLETLSFGLAYFAILAI
jgi:hypothetical protein